MWPEGTLSRGLAALALLVAAAVAVAQGRDDAQRRYRIEVLVFARAPAPDPAYRWPGEPDTRDALVLPPLAGEAPTALTYPSVLRVRPFEAVPLAQARSVAERLERLAPYRLLVARAWEQDAIVFGDPAPVRVQGGRRLDEASEMPPQFTFVDAGSEPEPVHEVDGFVGFERGRYTHLRVDLVYREPDDGDRGGVPHLAQRADMQLHQDYRAYRIAQRQQVRLGEYQYYDHPRFGVLALVTEVTPRKLENE